MNQAELTVAMQIRLPVPLAEKMRASAVYNRRSYNKEIQFLLERALEKKEAVQPTS